jgi:hypothetical protein
MPPRLDRRGGWRGADARPSLILASSPPTADWMVIAWSCASLAAVARIRQDGGGEELIEGVRAGLQQRSHVFGPAVGQVHVPASAGIPPNASSTLAAACAAAYSALVDPRVQPPYSGGQSRLGCAQRSLLGMKSLARAILAERSASTCQASCSWPAATASSAGRCSRPAEPSICGSARSRAAATSVTARAGAGAIAPPAGRRSSRVPRGDPPRGPAARLRPRAVRRSGARYSR